MRYLIIMLTTLLLALPAAAQELPHFFKGVRPLGMGGAFTAVADDENSLFYNPAGLNRIEQWSMGLINPLIDSSEGNLDFYDDLQDTDLDVTSEVTDLIRKYLGETVHIRTALFPHFATKNIAVAALTQIKTNLQYNNAAFPEVDTEVLATASAHLGLAHGWQNDNLRIGLGLKHITAGKLQEVYDAGEISDPNFGDQVEDDLIDDSGFGIDIGGIYSIDPIGGATPTFGITLLNVADTDLGDAGELPQQVNIGVSLTRQFGRINLTGAADWIDIFNDLDQDEDFFKRLHFGLEAKFPRILSLRAGLSQGYGSFGIGLDFKLLKLEYANYAEELSSYAGGKADRRHVLQIALGW